MTKAKTKPSNDNQLIQKTRDYGRQFWLASLGIYANVQQQGNEFFEKLIKEGEKFDKDIDKRVKEARKTASERREKMAQKTQDTVSNLLHRLGMSTHDEIQKLSKRVDTLSNNVKKLSA